MDRCPMAAIFVALVAMFETSMPVHGHASYTIDYTFEAGPPAIVLNGSHSYKYEFTFSSPVASVEPPGGEIEVNGTSAGKDVVFPENVGVRVTVQPPTGGEYTYDDVIVVKKMVDVVEVAGISGPDVIALFEPTSYDGTTNPPGYENDLRWRFEQTSTSVFLWSDVLEDAAWAAGAGSGPFDMAEAKSGGTYTENAWVLLNSQRSPEKSKTIQAVNLKLEFNIGGPGKGNFKEDISYSYKETKNENAKVTVYEWSADGDPAPSVGSPSSATTTIKWPHPVKTDDVSDKLSDYNGKVSDFKSDMSDFQIASGHTAKKDVWVDRLDGAVDDADGAANTLKAAVDWLWGELDTMKTWNRTVTLKVKYESITPPGALKKEKTKTKSVTLKIKITPEMKDAYKAVKDARIAEADASFDVGIEGLKYYNCSSSSDCNSKLTALEDTLNTFRDKSDALSSAVNDLLSVMNS